MRVETHSILIKSDYHILSKEPEAVIITLLIELLGINISVLNP